MCSKGARTLQQPLQPPGKVRTRTRAGGRDAQAAENAGNDVGDRARQPGRACGERSRHARSSGWFRCHSIRLGVMLPLSIPLHTQHAACARKQVCSAPNTRSGRRAVHAWLYETSIRAQKQVTRCAGSARWTAWRARGSAGSAGSAGSRSAGSNPAWRARSSASAWGAGSAGGAVAGRRVGPRSAGSAWRPSWAACTW